MTAPPHDLAAETALLGAVMLTGPTIRAALEAGVTAEDFYRPAHRLIFDAACRLHERGGAIDPVTLAAELGSRLDDVGGRQQLVTLQAATPASANAPTYAATVRAHARRRQVIAAADTVREAAMTGDGLAEAEAAMRVTLAESRGPSARRQVALVRASEVRMEQVRFAIARRVPLGGVTLLVGMGGLGKSTLTISWAAQLTRGDMAGDLQGQAVDVVIASAEDARAAVLKPRFVAAGADPDRVHFIDVISAGVADSLSLPVDVDELAEKMRKLGARLLIVDPLIAHIPMTLNADRDQHVRHALAPLARLAESEDIAIVGVMHLNKREASDVMVRVNGSGGFVNAARSVLAVGADPEDPERRIVAHAKCNVAELAASQRFRIESRSVTDEDGTEVRTSGVVLLGDAPTVSASDLLRSMPDSVADDDTADAQQVLEGILAEADEQSMWVKEAVAAMAAAGFSKDQAKRAKAKLHVRSIKVGRPGDPDSGWQWVLPRAPEGSTEGGEESGAANPTLFAPLVLPSEDEDLDSAAAERGRRVAAEVAP